MKRLILVLAIVVALMALYAGTALAGDPGFTSVPPPLSEICDHAVVSHGATPMGGPCGA